MSLKLERPEDQALQQELNQIAKIALIYEATQTGPNDFFSHQKKLTELPEEEDDDPEPENLIEKFWTGKMSISS